jgi:predicted nucleic acid-binding protein
VILLDTNVISEMMRPDPRPSVVDWYRSRQRHHLYTTTITLAETLSGIMMLPLGSRRAGMEIDARALFEQDFDGRILVFDLPAAELYGQIVAERWAKGRPNRPLDAQIAAIARANRMSVATRNIRDFADCGVDLINPWGG